MAKQDFSRRKFVRNLATTALGVTIVPRHVLGGPGYQAPSDTLNIAPIGAGGMGASNMARLTSENIVAICDVDWDRVDGSFRDREGNIRENRATLKEAYDKAKRYDDFRVMLEQQKDIDAVVIATPDHTHAAAATMAMNLGKHVYVQKPLTWSIYEARVLSETAEKTGVATQMGNQGHSSDDARKINEWIQAGAIGPVREVHIWTNRPIWPQGQGRPAESMKVPKNLNWDLWLGPAPKIPYHESYAPFAWRGWIDYGTGALGDMGAHLVDHPYWALGLTYPKTIEATSSPFGIERTGSGRNDYRHVSYPQATLTHYEFPAQGMLPPVHMTWYDGGLMPKRPHVLPESVPMNRSGGVIFVGEKGILMHETYGSNPRLYPEHLMDDYANTPQTFERIKGGRDGHEMNWVNDACKGTEKACCPLPYAARLTETMLLGVVALRTGQGVKLHYDAENMKITNVPEANEFLHREYREGWTL